MRRAIVLAMSVAMALTLMVSPAIATGSSTGVLNVVHGIPGLDVDVCASGDVTGNEFAKVAEDFVFKDIATLELPEGAYDATVIPAGGDCVADAVLSASGLFLPAGANVSVVANLDADGTPELSVFVNDTSRLRWWQTSLTVRHTAAAPEVDVVVERRFFRRWWPVGAIFQDVANGEEGTKVGLVGKYRVSVNLADTDTTVLGPAKLWLPRRTGTIVYAVGSAADGTLDVIVQKVSRR